MLSRIKKAIILTALMLIATACAPKMQVPVAQSGQSKTKTASDAGTEDAAKAGTASAAGTEEAGKADTDEKETTTDSAQETTEAPETADEAVFPAVDFTLTDQYGNTHTLSDYKGSVVFLNFWATWCPPCRAEMPDIQKLYEEYEAAEDDSVVILGVAAPGLGGEKDIAGITEFLSDNGYTYPVVMDETGDLFMQYYVFSYPTTYMIDREGNVFGYLTGSMPESTMRDVIEQTLTGVRKQPNNG